MFHLEGSFYLADDNEQCITACNEYFNERHDVTDGEIPSRIAFLKHLVGNIHMEAEDYSSAEQAYKEALNYAPDINPYLEPLGKALLISL